MSKVAPALPSMTPRLAALLFAGLLAAGAARGEPCEGTPSAAKLVILVDNVHTNRGLMTASLYPDDRTQFLVKDGALKVWWVRAAAPVSRLCIWLKSPGWYAVGVYQDLNSNHHLDKGALGPAEPWGVSRNPRVFFAAPSLAAARFQAEPGTTTLRIHLHDPL